jgi:uncharacterized protein YehS (DUF1456 family)
LSLTFDDEDVIKRIYDAVVTQKFDGLITVTHGRREPQT